MKLFRKIAVVYLFFLVSVGWGVMVGRYEMFPFSIFSGFFEFIEDETGDEPSFVSRFLSDEGFKPTRFIYPYDTSAAEKYPSLDVPGLRDRRAQPRLFISDSAPRGYRIYFGAMDSNETFWGALLIDPDGKLVHTWRLSTDELPGSTEPAYRKNMYGVAILPDGSVIFQMQETGGGIVRVDYCGRPVWVIDGSFHHAASVTDKGTFWTFEGSQGDFDHILAEFRVDTGAAVRRIDMADVRKANPDTHIFDLQRVPGIWDAIHGNDIEQLPRSMRQFFPDFRAGDLLISFHTINLVFILDPDTLEIKWWRIGPWDRQHDPDWGKDGRITVYSNNWRGVGEYSNIVSIDPSTLETRYLVKGQEYGFYSEINGKAQITDAGTVLIASSTQGRIFEVARNGDVVTDFVNIYGPGETLHVAEGVYLGSDIPFLENPPTCEVGK